jgi:hypothetical protein
MLPETPHLHKLTDSSSFQTIINKIVRLTKSKIKCLTSSIGRGILMKNLCRSMMVILLFIIPILFSCASTQKEKTESRLVDNSLT